MSGNVNDTIGHWVLKIASETSDAEDVGWVWRQLLEQRAIVFLEDAQCLSREFRIVWNALAVLRPELALFGTDLDDEIEDSICELVSDGLLIKKFDYLNRVSRLSELAANPHLSDLFKRGFSNERDRCMIDDLETEVEGYLLWRFFDVEYSAAGVGLERFAFIRMGELPRSENEWMELHIHDIYNGFCKVFECRLGQVMDLFDACIQYDPWQDEFFDDPRQDS